MIRVPTRDPRLRRSEGAAARLPVALVGILVALLVTPRAVAPPLPPVSETELQAAYLYYFAKFIEWPDSAFASKRSPVVIGILGVDPFGDVLDSLVADKYANGRGYRVVRYRRWDRPLRCHILFIADSEKRRFPRIVTSLEHRPVLTVSDIPRFAREGGMIEFVRTGKKLRMVIQRSQAERAGLRIRSDLLDLATVLTDPKEE